MRPAKVRPAKLRAGMLRSAAGKVVWVGRATVFLVGLAVILALVLGAASVAMSATGQPFVLGKQNTANKVTKLIRHGAGVALSLEVQNGQPPMKVDSDAKVANLNSDQLDGKSEADFYAAGSKVADSAHADQADTAASATHADNADDADLLDGLDSTQFAGYGATAYSPEKIAKGCLEQELASKTFSVPRETHIYASITALYEPDQLTFDYELQLLDASNGDILASAGSTYATINDESGLTVVPLTLQGVLNSGDDPYDSATTPFVATPDKNYKLRFVKVQDPNCDPENTSEYPFTNIVLSYLLIGER